MIRPLDAVVLTAALVLLPFAVRRATVSWVAFLGLGLAAGWGPWLVEMTGRFGSPAEAFAAAARLGHTGRWSLFENARQYLALSDGPSIGPVANPGVPASGVLWLLGLAILVMLGLRLATSRGVLASLVVPTAAGVALAAEYIVFTDAQAPRFLLPALALLTIPAGFGLASMFVRAPESRGSPAARVAPIVVAALVVGWGILQFVVATRVEAGVTEQRASAQRVGLRIRDLAARQPCLAYSEANFPIVGYAAGCRAAPLGKALEHGWTEPAASKPKGYGRSSCSSERGGAVRPRAPPSSRRSRHERTCGGSSTAGPETQPHHLHDDDPSQLGADGGSALEHDLFSGRDDPTNATVHRLRRRRSSIHR